MLLASIIFLLTDLLTTLLGSFLVQTDGTNLSFLEIQDYFLNRVFIAKSIEM
jgi:hypothetical protein